MLYEFKRHSEPKKAKIVPRRSVRLAHNVHYALWDGMCSHLCLGLSEQLFPAFLMAYGLGEVNAGLITTLPLLSGALVQLFLPIYFPYLRSPKQWLLGFAGVQGLTLTVLSLLAYLKVLSGPLLFLIVSLYWAMSFGIQPVWNLWISQVIPKTIHASFFSLRNRLAQVCIFIAFLFGGIFLSYTPGLERTHRYALLFLLASLFRFISMVFLHAQKDSRIKWEVSEKLSLDLFTVKLPKSNRHFILYLLAMQFMVQLSSPYFTPFMLGPLHLKYKEFTLLICASIVSKILIFPWAGRKIKQWGADRVLLLSAIGVSIVPTLWCFSQNFYYLILVQAITGMVWAGHDLASLMLIFQNLRPAIRVAVLVFYNFFNSAFASIASLLGASLLDAGHRTHQIFLWLFFISTLGRFAAITLIGQKNKTPASSRETLKDAA